MRDLSELMNFGWRNIQKYSIPIIAMFLVPRGKLKSKSTNRLELIVHCLGLKIKFNLITFT